MEVTRTETREVQVVEDVICDRCGNSLKSDIGNINGAVIAGGGGYDSTHFPDMHAFKSDVCEPCCAEWFKTFKRNPLSMNESAEEDHW